MRQDLGFLRDPVRLAAILILVVCGAAIAVWIIARGDLVGADARAYWGGVRLWLGGGDPLDPPPPYMPYVYWSWSLPLFTPWAALPWETAWFVYRVVQHRALRVERDLGLQAAPAGHGAPGGDHHHPAGGHARHRQHHPALRHGYLGRALRGAAAGWLHVGPGRGPQVVPAAALPHPAAARPGSGASPGWSCSASSPWPCGRRSSVSWTWSSTSRGRCGIDYVLLIWAAVPWLWAHPRWFDWRTLGRAGARDPGHRARGRGELVAITSTGRERLGGGAAARPPLPRTRPARAGGTGPDLLSFGQRAGGCGLVGAVAA